MKTKLNLWLRIASANLMELPRHDNTVDDAIDRSTGPRISIVGWQEASNEVYRDKLRALRRYTTRFAGINNTYNAPTSHDKDKWLLVGCGARKIFDGREGIAYTRHLEWVKLRLIADPEVQIVHINLHAPVVKSDRKELRLGMRKETKAVLNELVKTVMTAGLPVVITGDLNDSSRWFPTRVVLRARSVVTRRSYTVSNRIDQITFINGAKYKWKVLRKHLRKTTSDHDTILADVFLQEK